MLAPHLPGTVLCLQVQPARAQVVPGGAQAAHARGDVRSQQAVKQMIQSLACPQAVPIAFAQSQVAVGQNAFGNAVSQQVDVPGPRPVKAHIC